MKSLRSLLFKKFPEKKLSRAGALDDKTVFFVFKKVIQEEFGNLGVENFVPDYFSKETLFIKCKSSAWSSELRLNKNKIIKKINKELGEDAVREIKNK